MKCSLEEMIHGEVVSITSEEFRQLTNELATLRRDSARLDFLEQQNSLARYTGKCVFRLSVNRRGWRLHETSRLKGAGSVRQAIDNGMVALKEELQE